MVSAVVSPLCALSQTSYTVPGPTGSGTTRVAARNSGLSDGEPPPPKLGPENVPSSLMYATTCARSVSSSSSTHSVDPIKPHSSASQVAKTTVRAGFCPSRANAAKARAVSSTDTVPLTLSRAPGPQASR